jgi:hypothetical protein
VLVGDLGARQVNTDKRLSRNLRVTFESAPKLLDGVDGSQLNGIGNATGPSDGSTSWHKERKPDFLYRIRRDG